MQERSYKIGVVHGNQLLSKFAFNSGSQGVFIIGRKSPSDIIINDDKISSQHVQIIHNENNEIYLIDLKSSNGTFINGKQINPGVPYPITEQDQIVLASSSIQLTFNPDNFQPISAQKDDLAKKRALGSTNIMERLNAKGKVIIGRSSECDVVLPDQTTVSRKHASIELKQGRIYITDLGSMNGTFVNGKNVKGTIEIQQNDKIIIGRNLIQLIGKAIDLSSELAIKAVGISKKFANNKIGLHSCTFEIPAKSLTAVMGPSGCGKSTLLKALNGDSPPSNGSVTIAGLDLEANFDYLKSQIGYVPQDDIVHKDLTVYQSLYFSARLRLQDADESLINKKINELLTDLRITHIKENKVGAISGGQRKRVAIAIEILSDPLILFLDEPTSPLDPQTIAEFLEILNHLAKKGTTIIMVTHKPEDLNYMNSVMFLAEGGHLIFHGNSSDYLSFFNVQNTIKAYEELALPKAEKWIQQSKSQQKTSNKPFSKLKSDKLKTDYIRQFYWLTRRYFTIKFNDINASMLMIAQAPIIAILICLIFNKISPSVPFLMAISAIWFGTNNAAREIVGEASIYKRERMFNQGIFPYIFSKLMVLSTFSAIQSIVFVTIIALRYGSTDPSWHQPGLSIAWMFMLSVTASLLGLLLSATAKSTEKVMSLVPIALIPQIMLAGALTQIKSTLIEVVSYFTIARWGNEGFSNIQKEVVMTYAPPTIEGAEAPKTVSQDVVVDAIPELLKNFHGYEDRFKSLAGTLNLDVIAMSVLSVLMFIIILIAMKRKDSIRIK